MSNNDFEENVAAGVAGLGCLFVVLLLVLMVLGAIALVGVIF